MNVSEFAAAIKAKYPDYASLDDSELTARIIAKYPQYESQVQLDPRTAITMRKANPPAAAMGDPNGDRSLFGSTADTLASTGKGIVAGLGGPTNLKDAAIMAGATAINPIAGPALLNTMGMVNNVQNANQQAGKEDTTAGVLARSAGAIPIVGPAISAVAQPSVAYGAENRPPTQAENQAAIQGGAQLATQAAMISPTVRAGVSKATAPIGKVMDAINTSLTETIPNKMSNATIGATRKYFKFGANPGEAIKDMAYNSIEELPDRIQTEKVVPLANKLKQVLTTDAAKTKVIDLDGNIEHAFSGAIDAAKRDGNVALEGTLTDRMAGRIKAAHDLSGGARYVTPDVAYEVMQQLGEDTKWTNNADEATVQGAKQEAYRNLNAAVDKAIPAAVPLTRQLSNALTAQKAIRAAIENGQSAHPLVNAWNTGRRITGALGAIAGIATGHPEYGLGAAATAFAPDVVSAAPISSRISAGLSKMGTRPAPLPQTTPSAPQAVPEFTHMMQMAPLSEFQQIMDLYTNGH